MSDLGAHVSGWSAFIVDAILRRDLKRLLPAMSDEQRRVILRTARAVHAAALLYEAERLDRAASVGGSAEAVLGEMPTDLNQEIGTEQAAVLLGVSGRRICQLAAIWADHGLARKVGRSWLIDRSAVEMYRSERSAA